MTTLRGLGRSAGVVGSVTPTFERFIPGPNHTADSPKRRLGARRLFLTGLLIAGVTILVVGALNALLGSQRLAADFWLTYLPGAQAVVDGESPYPRYTYPPQVAFAYVPFTLLPGNLGAFLAVLASAGFLVATLATLGVRDGYCYLAVFVWAPTWQELDMANVTPALTLGLALAWRYRQSVWPLGIALGLAVPAKLFLWPVLCWTLAMRRFRACAIAISVGLVVTFGTWAVLRFQGLTAYPSLLHDLEEWYGRQSYSFLGIASAYGLDTGIGRLTALAIGGALLVGCVVLAHRGDELRSFTLALTAALALTPIIWLHYLLLLLVPLAIGRPRFSALWLLPVLLWVGSTPMKPAPFLPLLVCAVLVYRLLKEPAAHCTPVTHETATSNAVLHNA